MRFSSAYRNWFLVPLLLEQHQLQYFFASPI